MICTILLLSALFFGIHLSFGQEVEKKALTIGDVLLLPSWRDFRWSYNGTFIAYTRDDIDRENYNRTSHIWIYSVQSGETYQLQIHHRENPARTGSRTEDCCSIQNGKG